jgi:hypothetical protein
MEHQFLSRRALAAATTIAALTCGSHALATGTSIVGEWATVGSTCTGNKITIEPLSLRQSELRCRFRSVSRTGDVVTWRGECTLAAYDPESASYFPAKVVARLTGQTLNVIVNDGNLGEFDGRLGSFQRCSAHRGVESSALSDAEARAQSHKAIPIPLDRGAYVQTGSPCDNPPMFAVSSYVGEGFGVAHDHCDIESVKTLDSGAYALNKVCTVIQMDTFQSLHVTLRPLNRRTYVEIVDGLKPLTYRWCATGVSELFTK